VIKTTGKPGWWSTAVIPAVGRLRQDDQNTQDGLGYRAEILPQKPTKRNKCIDTK
jgi:hypothetical protein